MMAMCSQCGISKTIFGRVEHCEYAKECDCINAQYLGLSETLGMYSMETKSMVRYAGLMRHNANEWRRIAHSIAARFEAVAPEEAKAAINDTFASVVYEMDQPFDTCPCCGKAIGD